MPARHALGGKKKEKKRLYRCGFFALFQIMNIAIARATTAPTANAASVPNERLPLESNNAPARRFGFAGACVVLGITGSSGVGAEGCAGCCVEGACTGAAGAAGGAGAGGADGLVVPSTVAGALDGAVVTVAGTNPLKLPPVFPPPLLFPPLGVVATAGGGGGVYCLTPLCIKPVIVRLVPLAVQA